MCHKTTVNVNPFLPFKLLLNLGSISAASPLSFNCSLGCLWCMIISGPSLGPDILCGPVHVCGPESCSDMIINQSTAHHQLWACTHQAITTQYPPGAEQIFYSFQDTQSWAVEKDTPLSLAPPQQPTRGDV